MFEQAALSSEQASSAWQPALAAAPSRQPLRIDCRDLMAGGNELVIEHDGAEYHLRLTRNNRLILTK